jgi:hypothetical protein
VKGLLDKDRQIVSLKQSDNEESLLAVFKLWKLGMDAACYPVQSLQQLKLLLTSKQFGWVASQKNVAEPSRERQSVQPQLP